MAASDVPVPNLVRDALRRDGAYDFGLGVVLRAPTDPAGSGGSASYRVEHRVAPLMPGTPAPARRQGYSRNLAVAYARAQAVFEEMQQRAGGSYVEYHTEVPFGTVVQRWQDSPHPRWGAHYPEKVASLLRCWVVADAVTVHWRPAGPPTPIADLPVGVTHYREERPAMPRRPPAITPTTSLRPTDATGGLQLGAQLGRWSDAIVPGRGTAKPGVWTQIGAIKDSQ